MEQITDSLVIINLDNPDEVKSRKAIIDKFNGAFLKKELSSTKGKGNITNGDKLIFPGYFVSRMDLIQMLFDISKDITVDKVSFQDLLAKVMTDPNVKASNKNKIGLGINFGYSFSDEIKPTATTPKIQVSQELQLVFDTIGIVESTKPSRMISCYTTANLTPNGSPTMPPSGGTKYPSTE